MVAALLPHANIGLFFRSSLGNRTHIHHKVGLQIEDSSVHTIPEAVE